LADGALTPEQILDTAEDVLRRFGLQKTTVVDVARALGVSHGSIYRHFPSKAKMFEGLIEFVEDAVFSRVAQIVEHSDQADDAIAKLLHLLLAFTERNPGITRIFNGDALAGEHERLRGRVQQFYDRLEMQLRQILREAELREGKRTRATANATANLLMAFAEGRIGQFVRSDFKRAPTQDWEEQWALLQDMLFR